MVVLYRFLKNVPGEIKHLWVASRAPGLGIRQRLLETFEHAPPLNMLSEHGVTYLAKIEVVIVFDDSIMISTRPRYELKMSPPGSGEKSMRAGEMPELTRAAEPFTTPRKANQGHALAPLPGRGYALRVSRRYCLRGV